MSRLPTDMDREQIIQHPKVQQSARVGLIIVIALAMGIVSFAMVVLLQGQPWNGNMGLLTLLSMMLLAGALVMYFVLPRVTSAQLVRSIRQSLDAPSTGDAAPRHPLDGPLGRALEGLQVLSIIRAALLEGAAFMGLIAAMLEGSAIGFFIAAAAVLGILFLLPTPTRLADQVLRIAEELRMSARSAF